MTIRNLVYKKIVKEYAKLGIDSSGKKFSNFDGPVIPEWVKEGPIYEIYVRAFSRSGSFNEVEKKLDYLKDFGIKTIWLMPLFPIGKKGRKGKLGSPYSIMDYFKTNPEYGTEENLKSLISSAHKKNLRIILDMVPNHAANDHILISDKPEMFYRDENGDLGRKVSDWSDVTDWDYSNKETWNYMKSILKYWITEFDFDGFRCDVAGLLPTEFWDEVIDELKQIKPDIFMLAEWESPDLHVKAFNSTYNWTLFDLVKDVVFEKKPASLIIDYILEKIQVYPQNAYFLQFIENHDYERSAQVFGKKLIKPLAALFFTQHGLPLIYAGQEIGETNKPSHFDQETIKWENGDDEVFLFYKNLISLRKQHSAFSSEKQFKLDNDYPDEVLSYVKEDKNEEMIVLINLSNLQKSVTIPESTLINYQEYVDLFQNKTVSKQDLFSGNLRIGAYQFYILVNTKN